jgi:hypothetical protein
MILTTTLHYLTVVLLIGVLSFPGWVAKSISMAFENQVEGWMIQILAACILLLLILVRRHRKHIKNRRVFFDDETVKNRLKFNETNSRKTFFLLKSFCCTVLILWLLMIPDNASGGFNMSPVTTNSANLRQGELLSKELRQTDFTLLNKRP